MSYTPEKLLTLASEFEELSKHAKDKKKLDPKAKVRNRGTVCVPASSAKDKKDHFPINSIEQARNALARVHQYDKAPSWYGSSLKSLQELVSRKVHSKYPSIGKEKKSSIEDLLTKYADTGSFYQILQQYDTGALPVRDFAEAMKMTAETFGREANLDDANERRTYDLMLKQAHLVFGLVPEIEAIDNEIENGPTEVSDEEPTIATINNKLLKKYADVRTMTDFLANNYEGTAALLRDLAVAQFTVGDNDPNDTEHENYQTNKKLHDMIMRLASEIEPIEQTMW